MLFSFFDSKAQKKMELFAAMQASEVQNFNAMQLCQTTGFSYRMTIALLLEMNEELETIFSIPLLNKQNKILWDKHKFQRQAYQQYLIQQSIPHRFLLFTLKEPTGGLELFCQQNFLSPTSARRALKPLQKYVQNYDIRLNISGAYFQGKESVIRLLYFNFFWLSSAGRSLLDLYESAEPELYAKLKAISFAFRNPQEAAVYLTISLLRIRQGRFVEPLTMEPVEIPLLIEPLTELYEGSVNSPELRKNEVYYALFTVYYKLYCIDPNEQRLFDLQNIYNKLRQDGHPIAMLSHAFHENLNKYPLASQLSVDQKQLIQVSIFNIFMMFYLLGEVPPYMKDLVEDNLDLEDSMMQKIRKPVAQQLKKLNRRFADLDLDFTKPKMIDLIVSILAPYFNQGRVKLQVGIIQLPNYHKMQELVLFLEQLNFVDVIFCYTRQEEVDVVILNYGTEPPSDSPYLFANQDYEVSTYYKELFASLMDLYQAKLKQTITNSSFQLKDASLQGSH